MNAIIRLKIDVTKIDKSALFSGAKGTYLDATLFLDDNKDQWGNNGSIRQDLGKERRAKGEKGAILGNAKIIKMDLGEQEQQPAPQPKRQLTSKPMPEGDDYSEIPF